LVVVQAPVCVLVAIRLGSRRLSAGEALLVALAFWSWLQIAALSYGRVNYGPGSPRYTDLLAVGVFANCLALLVISTGVRRRTMLGSAAVAWIVLVALGLREQDREAQARVLGDYPALKSAERRHIKAFLDDGKIADLRSAPPWELPYPGFEALGRYLSAGGIRSMLPMGIRPAVDLAAGVESNGFVATGASGLPEGYEGRVWIARRGPAKFVSLPLATTGLPIIHMAFCGSSDLNGSVVHLESADGDEYVPANPLTADGWQTVDFSVSRDMPARLVVDIPPGIHWFAFTEPVEVGSGSWANRWLLRRSAMVAAISGILLAGALAAIAFTGAKRVDP